MTRLLCQSGHVPEHSTNGSCPFATEMIEGLQTVVWLIVPTIPCTEDCVQRSSLPNQLNSIQIGSGRSVGIACLAAAVAN